MPAPWTVKSRRALKEAWFLTMLARFGGRGLDGATRPLPVQWRGTTNLSDLEMPWNCRLQRFLCARSTRSGPWTTKSLLFWPVRTGIWVRTAKLATVRYRGHKAVLNQPVNDKASLAPVARWEAAGPKPRA